MKKLILPMEKLCKKYLSGISTNELAKEYGCCVATIRTKLRNTGIKMRTNSESHIGSQLGKDHPNYVDIPIEEICKKYLSGISSEELAKEYGCSSPTIRTRLRNNGIKMRTNSEAQTGLRTGENHHNYIDIPIEEICEDYINGMSRDKLAKKYNCSRAAIDKRLHDSGIKIRSHTESQIKRWEDPEQRESAKQKAIEQWEDPVKRAKLSGENSTSFRHQGEESNAWRGGKVIVKCNTCGHNIERYPSQVGDRNFCDLGCRLEYKNTNYINTNIEIIIQDILTEKCIKFETHSNILSYYPDILIPEYNIIIECDGDYWHGNENTLKTLKDWQKRAQLYDKRKDEMLSDIGYTVIRFWGSDIEDNIELCINKLDLIMETKNDNN